MKKILVPIDFSPASRNAAEYAASLAEVLAAPLELLHVYKEPVPSPGLNGVWLDSGISFVEENEEWVEEEVIFLKEKYGVDVIGEVKEGSKGDTISMLAKESEASMVVMGMKEAKRNKFLDSTVFTALHRTRIPVLVIPEGLPYRPVRNIVLAADFNGVSDASCFDLLMILVEKFDAALQVVHVAGKEAAIKPEELSGKLQMGKILAKVTYWYHQLDKESVEESILQFVENHPADLLVMVAHKHKLFERLFGTIYTRDISNQASLPLLVLKDKTG